jgi:hypothetical protein
MPAILTKLGGVLFMQVAYHALGDLWESAVKECLAGTYMLHRKRGGRGNGSVDLPSAYIFPHRGVDLSKAEGKEKGRSPKRGIALLVDSIFF